MSSLNDISQETLQRLIDFAHAAMSKRQDTPDDYPMNHSRAGDDFAVVYAKDWREVQKLGKASWEASQ